MPSSNLYIQVTKLKSATWDTKLEMIKSRVSALVHRLGHTDGPNLANNRTTVYFVFAVPRHVKSQGRCDSITEK